jgi:hypothetical protein
LDTSTGIQAALADGRNTTAGAIIHAAKLAKAEEVQTYWRDIAPVRGDKPTNDSPLPFYDGKDKLVNERAEEYRDSIKVVDTGRRVRVGTSDMPLAGWLEYDSIRNPEHGYATRVLAHFGGSTGERGDRVIE